MTFVRRILGIGADECGQGMTEFVIVIPLILYFFFVMIQFVLLAQVAQMGNYAAFVAARVHAVRGSWDPEAERKASLAAAIAYAPVSLPAPNEFFLPTAQTSLPLDPQSLLGSVAGLVEGFAVARARLALGGDPDISLSGSGDMEQVDVNLVYACPVWVPGVVELWTLATNGQDARVDLAPLGSGLSFLAQLLPYPYIAVHSKCSMGFEPWSGEPRERATVRSDSSEDPDAQEQIDAMEDARQRAETAQADVDTAKQNLQDAEDELVAAQSNYNVVMANPNSTQAEKDAAQSRLDAAQTRKEDAKQELEGATQRLSDALDDLNEYVGV